MDHVFAKKREVENMFFERKECNLRIVFLHSCFCLPTFACLQNKKPFLSWCIKLRLIVMLEAIQKHYFSKSSLDMYIHIFFVYVEKVEAKASFVHAGKILVETQREF